MCRISGQPRTAVSVALVKGALKENAAPTKKNESGTIDEKQQCPITSPLLKGPFQVQWDNELTLKTVRKQNPKLRAGGRWKPPNCNAIQKVAIVIPFRHREQHLKFWLYYVHPFLQRQQLDYGVYVVNQDGENKFNRAKLMNVGFTEALKEYDYDCFVFSDVDIIPLDDRNTYRCFKQPRHLAVSMNKFHFGLPYRTYVGGVLALSKEQYMKINGFPNNYWGWGGEDDDMYKRLRIRGMWLSRPDRVKGRCKMIGHKRDKHNESNPKRYYKLRNTRQTIDSDGINSLQYKVVNIEKDQLFTKITVDIGSPPRKSTS
ncbi:beta-1,4-galactosyltransferase 1-like isoform X2 [Engraulis encrasicolus]|uniref:beta-1,4-galactosyltransferase 1-like isoform X2 n=1 Tax=Engraulis encrasicolus TaxID=184585 RepID=UPI002FCED383